MKITPIGVGSAFALTLFQTMYIIENDGQRLLIDCGGDARHAVNSVGLSVGDIDSVYISHLHGDHIGGLEWLGFLTYFISGLNKPIMYIHERLKESLWSNGLSAGMESIQNKIVTLNDYFDVVSLGKNENFVWQNLTFQPVQTIHVMNGFDVVPSYGLLINSKDTTAFITTDTQHCPNQIMDFYNSSDVIYHDCETLVGLKEASVKSGVHAHYEDLATLPKNVREKMWFTHYGDNFKDFEARANKAGFKGFAVQGETHEYA